MKVCRVCKIELVVGENWLESYAKNSNYICRDCLREHDKEYRENNKQKRKEYSKEYYENNKEKIKEHDKEYYENNKEKRKEKNKEYYENNKEKIKEYREDGKEKLKEYQKEYTTKPESKRKKSERLKLRRQNDPWFDARCKLRNSHTRLIKNLLTGNDRDFSAVRNLGCNKEVFLLHIESLFQPGMTWENRGKNGWHYDHIISVAETDPNNKEAVKRLLHYTNIRPLWAVDNIRKGQEDKKKSIKYKSTYNGE